MAVLELSRGRDVEFDAAFGLALTGDSVRAQGLTNDLDKRFPEDTSVRFNYLPKKRCAEFPCSRRLFPVTQ
jgi:eukaryotic-like serine/threonine-protein kinase